MNGALNDPDAERWTLAACMASRTARDAARKHVRGADFYDPAHEAIWDAMGELDRTGTPVDGLTLNRFLQPRDQRAADVVVSLFGSPALPGNAGEYAEMVRGWSVRRAVYDAATRAHVKATNPEFDPRTLAVTTTNEFASIRDQADTTDAQSVTFSEVVETADAQPEWLINGLLERRDRLILTGTEGLGKSYLLRQLATMSAAGLDPFDPGIRTRPVSVLIIDCENSLNQVRRKVRPVVEFARKYGHENVNNVNLLCSSRLDLTSDMDLARVHRELDACQPELVVIGPLYRLVPRALQTDDEAAPLLAALDTIRDRGAALMIEAHAGHGTGKGHERDLRPRGSSALLGWPEFGYGMRARSDGEADLVPWRGDRDERAWPKRLRHDNQNIRWVPSFAEDNPIPQEAWGA